MPIDELIKVIARGTTEIINEESLRKKLQESLKSKRGLNIKAGFDPTAPDIHLGHVVLLRKLRQFQDLGHKIFFLIGDFTAQIGDPSGRDATRPKMDVEEIARNAKTYKAQIFKVLDDKKTEILFNSSWLGKLKSQEILSLTRYSTVAQMLARADFKKRFEEKREISLLEFLYPLLQGYDSVHLKADVELGGSDQKFNLLMGRQLQEAFGMAPQVVVMTPLLEGTDGVLKMSKSLGNTIGINESPKEIFGKVMSVKDELMMRYYELLTTHDLNDVKKLHPKEAKLKLAEEIVGQFHSKKEAKESTEDFERTFSQRLVPEDIPEHRLKKDDSLSLVDVLLKAGLAKSKNEVRRLIKQGAISLDGDKVSQEDFSLKEGILKVGKRRFLKLVRS